MFFSDDEYTVIKANATYLHMDVSKYLRAIAARPLMLQSANGKERIPTFIACDRDALNSLRRELLRQGVNIDQIAHALNSMQLLLDGGTFDDDAVRLWQRNVDMWRDSLIEIRDFYAPLANTFNAVVKGDKLLAIPVAQTEG
jgi:hypothetical protein